MRFKYLVIPVLMILTLACSKEQEVDGCSDNLAELILGSFEVETPDGKGIVTFKDDGSWTDPDNVLLSVNIGGIWLTDKTYIVKSQTLLEVKVQDDNGSRTAEYVIIRSSCEEITFTYEGIEATLVRI